MVYFEAVVRCGGFTRAAESLHIPQPAVSARIRHLEAELGVSLLVRTTRRVALTAAGELFLARTRRVLGELDSARSELDELAAVLRGRITLGATQVLGPLDLSGALATFHARFPGVALALRSGLIGSLLAALDSGEVDLVLGPIHPDLPSHYAAWPLAEEHLVIITPPSHRLAREPRVELADLREEPFVCLPTGSGLHAILIAASRAEDFEPRIHFETASPISIRELVSAGLGVALLARSAACTPGPPVAIHVLDPAPAHPPIGVIHHRDRQLSTAAQACRRHLIAAVDPSSQSRLAI